MKEHLKLIVALVVIVSNTVGADTVTLDPTDDAYISEGSPGSNYGNQSTLTSGYYGGYYETLIKFDLYPYMGTTVNGASLRLYVYEDLGGLPQAQLISRNTTDWSEGTVTWNNQPGWADISGNPGPYSWDWWAIDVTTLVQGFVDGSYENYGFQISKDGSDQGYFYIRSKEASSNQPELEINYTPNAIESESLGNIKAAFR